MEITRPGPGESQPGILPQSSEKPGSLTERAKNLDKAARSPERNSVRRRNSFVRRRRGKGESPQPPQRWQHDWKTRGRTSRNKDFQGRSGSSRGSFGATPFKHYS